MKEKEKVEIAVTPEVYDQMKSYAEIIVKKQIDEFLNGVNLRKMAKAITCDVGTKMNLPHLDEFEENVYNNLTLLTAFVRHPSETVGELEKRIQFLQNLAFIFSTECMQEEKFNVASFLGLNHFNSLFGIVKAYNSCARQKYFMVNDSKTIFGTDLKVDIMDLVTSDRYHNAEDNGFFESKFRYTLKDFIELGWA